MEPVSDTSNRQRGRHGLARHRWLVGIAAGWALGMLCWTGLVIAFTIADARRGGGEDWIERLRHVAGLLILAPVAAIPWAVVGLIVRAISALRRGYGVPVGAAGGMLVGGVNVLVTSPFDGWLTLTVPVGCLLGALVGAALGALWSTGVAVFSRHRHTDHANSRH
jgi:hypothetical protein